MKNEGTQIIILAAGKGVRMESEEPKALVLYKGKPFIEHILRTISGLNLKTKPIIVIGYKKERIKEILGDQYVYAEQAQQLGTGNAVKSAKPAIADDIKTIIVISADQPTISRETLENIISKHDEKKSTITIGTAIVPDFQEWRSVMNNFGRIIRKNDGSVKSIVEFKDANDEEKKIKELNLSLYAFDSKWLWNNIDKLQNKNVQSEYYLTDLVEIACNQDKGIEAVAVKNIIEAIHPNSKADLKLLENLSI